MSKKSLLLIVLPSLLAAYSNAHAWTDKDTAWEAAYLAAHAAEWGQQLAAVSECNNGTYSDSRISNGKCATSRNINTYFLSSAVIHAAIARTLPQKHRRHFQTSTLAMQAGVGTDDIHIGLKFNF